MRFALLLLLLAPMAAFAQFGAPPSILPYQGAPGGYGVNNYSNYSFYNQLMSRPQAPMFGGPFQSAFPGGGVGGFYPQPPIYQSPFGMPSLYNPMAMNQNHFGIGLNLNLANLFSGLSNIDTSSRANEYDDDDDDDYVPRHRHHHPRRVVEEDDDDDDVIPARTREVVEERPAVTAAHLSISRAPVVTPFGVRPGAGASLTVVDRQPVYHYVDSEAEAPRGERIARAEDDDSAALQPPPPISRPVTSSESSSPRPAAAAAVTQVRTAPVVRNPRALTPVSPDPTPTPSLVQRPFNPKDPKSAPVYNVVVQHYRECQAEGYIPSNCVISEWGTFGGRPNASCHPGGRAMDITALKCGGVRVAAIQSETAKGKPFHDMVTCMKSKMPYTLWHQNHGRGVTLDHYDNFHMSLGCHVNGRFTY